MFENLMKVISRMAFSVFLVSTLLPGESPAAGLFAGLKQAATGAVQGVVNSAKQTATTAVNNAKTKVESTIANTTAALTVGVQNTLNTSVASATGLLPSTFEPEVISAAEGAFPPIETIKAGKIINLSNKGLNDRTVEYLAKEKLPLLIREKLEKVTLNLANNNITSDGVRMILDALALNPRLVTIIDLSGNAIGDEGAIAIAEYCPRLVMLHSITLSGCQIGGDGAFGLISAIANIPDAMFQYLDLSNNLIDPNYIPPIFEQINLLQEGCFEDGINMSGIPSNPNLLVPGNVILNKNNNTSQMPVNQSVMLY